MNGQLSGTNFHPLSWQYNYFVTHNHRSNDMLSQRSIFLSYLFPFKSIESQPYQQRRKHNPSCEKHTEPKIFLCYKITNRRVQSA